MSTELNDYEEIKIEKATSSSNDKSTKPEYALDGKQDTRWSAKGEGEFLVIDLGKVHKVAALAIKWFESDIRRMTYTMYSGTDKNSYARIGAAVSSGIPDNEYEVHSFGRPIDAQYLKIEGEGNDLNSFISIVDIKALGPKPAETLAVGDTGKAETVTAEPKKQNQQKA